MDDRHRVSSTRIIRIFRKLVVGFLFLFCLILIKVNRLLSEQWSHAQTFEQRLNPSSGVAPTRPLTNETEQLQQWKTQGQTSFWFLTHGVNHVPKKVYQSVIHWNDRADLKSFMTSYFSTKNVVCDLVPSTNSTSKSADHYLLNISFSCNDLFYHSGLGSGNYIAGFYAVRLAAQVLGNIDVMITCPDAMQESRSLILPWLTGFFEVDRESSSSIRRTMQDRSRQVCHSIDSCPIGYLFQSIQTELRRMAIALAGIPPSSHSTHSAVISWLARESKRHSSHHLYLPFHIPKSPSIRIDLDDVIIHFRCGDLMDSSHPRFAFLSFVGLAKMISSSANSIGIVTQPFDDSALARDWDKSAVKRQRCSIVVEDFVRYLQEKFPLTHIRVHNHVNETIAATYARMVLANQTIAGISTFGVFPSIASFGTGYIRRPDPQSPTNNWLNNPDLSDLMLAHSSDKQLVLLDEPNILMVRTVKRLWQQPDGEARILAWFREESKI